MHSEVHKTVEKLGRHVIQTEHLASLITYLQHFDVPGNDVRGDIHINNPCTRNMCDVL